MDFSSIQSLGNYTKMLKMQTNWDKKRQSKNYLEKSDQNQRYNPETDPLAPYRQQLDEMRDSKNIAAETIYTKLRAGKKLSSDEMAYLAENDPESYRKAKEIQMEQEAYERKLKQCKTKDDVQRLKMVQVNKVLNAVNTIKNNPNIPEGSKLGLIMHEQAKLQATLDAEKRFVESGEYAKLPTDEERNEILKEEQERLEELKGTDGAEKEPENVEGEDQTDVEDGDKHLTTDTESTPKPEMPETSPAVAIEKKESVPHEAAKQAYQQMMNVEQDIRMEDVRRKTGVHKKV